MRRNAWHCATGNHETAVLANVNAILSAIKAMAGFGDAGGVKEVKLACVEVAGKSLC